MRACLLLCAAVAAVLTGPTTAQSAPRLATADVPTPDVVVRGVRTKQSGWREAETNHVAILSDGSEAELVRLTRNLERLHFLLAGLLGRSDAPDDTVKLRITLIGDVPEFDAMGLRNRRWQQGPYNELFTVTRYYDPREDGAVAASTRIDQSTVVERTPMNAQSFQSMLGGMFLGGTAMPQSPMTDPGATQDAMLATQAATLGNIATAGMQGEHDNPITFGEQRIGVSAESQLYAAYAQHFLLTYFPAAYPRWYVDGFAQVFSSLVVKGDTVLEYGRSPRGTSAVLRNFGGYPIGDVLNEKYLHTSEHKTGWTPIHAWMLTHFLLFSDTRRPQLRAYLAARAGGADAATAAQVFGDQKELTGELRKYFGAKKPYDVLTYPADRIEQPIVRRLSEGEAAFVKGRLELGARVLIPSPPLPGTDPGVAKRIASARDDALRARDRWLARLRGDAARWSGEPGAQLLLAEAECRSGNADPCLAAATRAVALAPADSRPLAWKGTALAMQAAAAPEAERPARLLAARSVIAAANRLDVEAVQPLLAYYASYAGAGQAPPVTAIDALQKAVGVVPAAPSTRLDLATALADRGQRDTARQVLMPVVAGPYDSPEKAAGLALAARLGPAQGATPGGAAP
jgi:hypothetical protein